MVFHRPYAAITDTLTGIWGYFFNRSPSPTDDDDERDDSDDQSSEDEDLTNTATPSPQGSLIAEEDVPNGEDPAQSPLPQSASDEKEYPEGDHPNSTETHKDPPSDHNDAMNMEGDGPLPQSLSPQSANGGRDSPNLERSDNADAHNDPSSDHTDAMEVEGDGPSPQRPSQERESPNLVPSDSADVPGDPSSDHNDVLNIEGDSPSPQVPSEEHESPEQKPPDSTYAHEGPSSDPHDAMEVKTDSAGHTTPPKTGGQDLGHNWLQNGVTLFATGGRDRETLPWGKNTVTSANAGLSKVQSRRRELNARFNVDMRADVNLEIHTLLQGDVVLGTFD
ncbi:hypothetical protein BDW42DRAFT_78914 [Aspergillus taichungensis]|uniref:Uncharacterized protein n=1 Tax=Aspergillus taichungensis TaxID=482145 RepID=A0A2J5HYF8_9EURO|nr:hypothetical protein BDW42DRAFT_78914 [Aspergillus taichungensis]